LIRSFIFKVENDEEFYSWTNLIEKTISNLKIHEKIDLNQEKILDLVDEKIDHLKNENFDINDDKFNFDNDDEIDDEIVLSLPDDDIITP
jgi:hypothetical protein